MKEKAWAIILALFVAAKGVGLLPQGREMEELSLITALAVDRAGAGVSLTAVTGVRAGEEEEPQVLTGEGADMAEACQAVQQAKATHAYLGQADKLLLGEELAQTELMKVLEFVLDHRDLRLDTLLYIVKGNAGEGLADSAPSTAGETPGRDSQGVTVGQALAKLCQGRTVWVPALAPGEDGILAPAGRARLEPGGLAGYDGGSKPDRAAVAERGTGDG